MTAIPVRQGSTAEAAAIQAPQPLDMLDLMFVIDNSESMAAKQAALRVQLPHLMQRLASGERFAGDPDPFLPIHDIHIGVVSSDMGLAGAEEVQGCAADGGDDGRLQRAAECGGGAPRFLSYAPPSATSVETLATDLACMTTLGTEGCRLQQPLDAALKALTQLEYVDAQGTVVGENPFKFISVSHDGTRGRGDRENLDFVRMDSLDGASLLAIVVITDDDDCSLRETSYLEAETDLKEHCLARKHLLFDVKARFYDGLRQLRPGRENNVVFAAIAGVPPDLVDAAARQNIEWQNAASRNAYYANILNDPRMQEPPVLITSRTLLSSAPAPSCVRQLPSGETEANAYPPRRIVELAQLFGENSALQSICQDDLQPAMDGIADLIQLRMQRK